MSNSAEEGLMALLEAMLTLAAREARRPKPPPVKPGGYPEEQFVDLSEDEKEEFSCSICYQILKETMQCVNNHKFCHSCLLVWSTTGQYANRIRCPVCRTHGYYFRNSDLDDRIAGKKVKCLLDSCSWSGMLKYMGSHRHTTYNASSDNQSESSSSSATTTMPRLAQASPRVPLSSTARFVGTGLTTSGTDLQSVAAGASSTPRPNIQSRASIASPSSLSSTSQETVIELPRRSTGPASIRAPATTGRTVIRRGQVPGPRGSGTNGNRITFSHTTPSADRGSNTEGTSTSSSSSIAPAQSSSSTTTSDTDNSAPFSLAGAQHTPRPPSAPRAANAVNTRRLPRIVNAPPPRPTGTRYQPPEAMALNLNPGNRSRPSESLGEIRDRLQESRTRLDNLMTTFSGELDRNRMEMAEFQQERERHRREQLEEVRELGQRLGQVASELRRLLEQRRHFASFSDEDDDDE